MRDDLGLLVLLCVLGVSGEIRAGVGRGGSKGKKRPCGFVGPRSMMYPLGNTSVGSVDVLFEFAVRGQREAQRRIG